MTSREEREEIAKKLREVGKGKNDWSMGVNEALFKVEDIISARYRSYEFLFNRLADLIDPTCKLVEAGNNIVCSECGADLYDDDLYCLHCGARVVRGPETLEQAALPANDFIDNQTLALAT